MVEKSREHGSGKRPSRSSQTGRIKPADLLLETRQRDDRKREQGFEALAKRAAEEEWSEDRAEIEVLKTIKAAHFGGCRYTEKTFDTLVAEGKLATHPAVRGQVAQLKKLRDEAWATYPVFLRGALHGPSQVLIDMMRRQRDRDERHHVRNLMTYMAYLHQRFSTQGRGSTTGPAVRA